MGKLEELRDLFRADNLLALSPVEHTLHPLRVKRSLMFAGEMRGPVLAAALLHDWVEDGHGTIADLRHLGLSGRCVELVGMLTRDPTETYRDCIRCLARDSDARAIKIHDILDNCNRGPIPGQLVERYEWALDYLMEVEDGNGY